MRRTPQIVALVLICLACSRPGPETLATYRGGEIAVADLDRYVRSLPEGRRTVPTAGRDAWLEGMIRSLAVERVLEAGDEVRTRLASPENEARRRWASAALLASAVTAELARDAPPTDEAVAEQIAALEQRQPVPLDTFRHIFLRLDRAATAAEKSEVRRQGQELARRARAGEDFAELARQYSQSASAKDGGLVENQRPARLEATARQVVGALSEGEISDLVETRTGLHVFKLERRIIPESGERDVQQIARSRAAREAVGKASVELLDELRQQVEVSTSELPWRIGSFEVTESELPYLSVRDPGDERQRRLAIEQLLLAEEGRRRGFDTPELTARVEAGLLREAIQAAYQKRRAERVSELPAERLRSLYEARPSAFATLETAEIDLIFVPQGRDSFTTQRRMETHVAELRAGADFAELARRISAGPSAAEGGDLGALPPEEWVRLGPEIYKTVAALEPGQISDPVYCTDRLLTTDPRTLRGGFAILRLEARHPPAERSFEEAIDDVRKTWAGQNAQQLDQELQVAILEEAEFEIVRLPEAEEFLQ